MFHEDTDFSSILETARSLLPISAARRPPAVEACFLPCRSRDSLFPSKSLHPLNFLLRFLPCSLLQGGGPPDSVWPGLRLNRRRQPLIELHSNHFSVLLTEAIWACASGEPRTVP